MDVSESESVSTDSKLTSEVLETPEDPLELDNAMSSSEKQHSIFSLTISEIQCRSGRSFGSMNMDEFLNSVWSDHEFQASSSVNDEAAANNENGTNNMEQTNLWRQGSLPLQLPTPLCGKTVDEVWAEIQQNSESQETDHTTFSEFMASSEALQLQTLGEMTLEEFLVKAGVIREASRNPSSQLEIPENLNQNLSGSYFSNSTCLETNNAGEQVMGFEFSTPSNCLGNGNGHQTTLLSNASSAYHHLFTLGSGGSGCLGESSSYDIRCGKSSSPPTAGESSNKRKISPPMEVAIERRQRRMIKNRESAARSRARKQAYTAELEIELNQVREENESLKRALEEAEQKLELQEVNDDDWQGKKNYRTLRKTRSF